jgi:predicted secreted protein
VKLHFKGLTVTLAALVLAACGEVPSSSQALTSIAINGANDVSVAFNETFNVFTGVTAVGNNGVSYTAQLTLSSTSTAVNTTTGVLDTSKTGLHTVRYSVTSGTITAQKFRNITVDQPARVGFLINADFSQGTAGWDDPTVVYNEGGSSIDMSIEEGALKTVVVASGVAYAPRFGQMNVPFVKDVTYQISFRAKASVSRPINLQVGELLAGPPYFTDFKPGQTEVRTITTAWANYSYKFTHKLDNDRGGLLFELGTVAGQTVNATLWFDDISVAISTPDPDTTAPVFTGVVPTLSLLVGSTYNPLAGVTAFDVVDGDVTNKIVVEIFNSSNAKVDAVVTTAPAVFTVKYAVTDLAGNKAEAQTVVSVVDLIFKNENLITNGSFATAIGEEWSFYDDGAATLTRSQNVELGTYNYNITNGGTAAWNIQMNQRGIELVQGTTYRLSFKGSSSVARSFSAAMISNVAGDFTNFNRKDGLQLGTTSSTVEFVFTFTQTTRLTVLTIELGQQAGFAASNIILEEVRLQRLDVNPLVTNSNLAMTGWRHFVNDWEGTVATSAIVNGEYKMTITKRGGHNGDNWKLQIVQDNVAFGESNDNGRLGMAAGKSYTLTFDMYASKAIAVTTFIGAPGVFINYATEATRVTNITTSKATYTLPVSTVGATLNGNEKLAFEFGTQFTNFETGNEFVVIDNVALKEGETVTPSVINGDMNAVVGGHQFITEHGGTMTRATDAGGASIVVPALGPNAYQPHYAYFFPTLAKGKYEVKIIINSTVARDIRFNVLLPDAGFASIIAGGFEDFAVTSNADTVFTYTFETTTQLTNVKLEIDFGTLGGTKTSLPGTFVLKEVLVYQNFNS